MSEGTGRIAPVVIVGAGPVGLVSALLLARQGVPSLILERYPEPYPLPRAVHLDDEAVRILQAAGIAEAFAALSRPAPGLRLLDARHRVMAEFRRDRLEGVHGFPQANLFDQPELERLLRDELQRHPDVQLRAGVDVLGVEVLDVEALDAARAPASAAERARARVRVRVRVRDVASGAERDLPARAVLGCDGANSTVRQAISSTFTDLGFEERWLVLDVEAAGRLEVWDGVSQVCDPRRAATAMWIGAGRYRWEFRLHPGESAASMTDGGRLSELLAPWLARTPDVEVRLRRAVEYTFRARLAQRWARGRVFLLGDAAHLTPPFIGQGLGSGLRDAQNLAWKLALVLDHGADEALLDTYQAEREPHARSMIRLAMLTGWAMTGGQDRAAALRRVLLALFCRVPGATRLVMRGLSPAGTLCPQPWVTVGGQRRRLDDVLGAGFAVLVSGTPDRPLDPRLLAQAGLLGARVVRVSGREPAQHSQHQQHLQPPHEPAVLDVESRQLADWLRRFAAAPVLLRPDRVVLLNGADRVTS